MDNTPPAGLAAEAVAIAAAVGFATLGLEGFLLPNGFLDGGVTGCAILLELITGLPLPAGIVALSVPFLALAYRTVARRIFVKSIVSIAALAVSLSVVSFPVITDDKLLIAIFGGLCLGLGIGLAVRNGAVLDGSEILGVFLNDRFGVSIGKVVLAFNVVLFSVTASLLSLESAMYSILTFLVAAEVTDVIIRGLEDFIGVTIVSHHPERIQRALVEEMGVGLTLFEGRGGYGDRGDAPNRPIIQTVVNRIDVRRLYRVIDEHDAAAFVLEFDVHKVRGGVLRHYLSRRRRRATPEAA